MTHAVAAGVIPAWDLTDRLTKARKHAGLRQSELAEISGISLRSIAGYETGRTSPRRPQLLAWAMACGVSLDWLMNGESPRPAGGPNGGLRECAIRDSNPEPADSVFRLVEFRRNIADDLPDDLADDVGVDLAPVLPHPRRAAELQAASMRAVA